MKSTSFTPGSSTSAGVARSFTCCICRLNKPPSDLVFLSGCSHGYCTMCTVRHLTAKVEQGVAVIACPMCGFGTFEPEMCKPLVAREVFDRWCDALLMNLADKNNWKKCSFCCYYVEKVSGRNNLVCRCGCTFCYNCGSTWIVNHSCKACKR